MNRNLLFIALALLTWGFGEGMFINFQPIYLKQLGSNEQQIGWILGAFGAAMAITHIPAGRLADRIGRRPLLITAWLVGLTATVIMAVARTLPVFIIGMLGYGLTAFVSSPLGSYVTAARGQWSVQTALSLTTATFSLGMVLGPLAGGLIGEHYELRAVYAVAAVCFVISSVFISFIRSQPIEQHDPAAPPLDLHQNQRLITFIGVFALAIFAMYLAQPLTPNYIHDVRGLKLNEVGLAFTLGALGNALLAVTLSLVPPRLGFSLAQILVGGFALLIWRGTTLSTILCAYFLLGGFRAARPIYNSQARSLVHGSQMGLTYGIMETVGAVVFILTPPLAGYLYKIDPALNYPIALSLIVVSVSVSLITLRSPAHA